MKTTKYVKGLLLAGLMGLIAACAEDAIRVDERLARAEYDFPRGEAGSLEEMIYRFYEKYGTCVLYRFTEEEIRPTWKYKWSGWYAPVLAGNEIYVKKLLAFLQEEVYGNYTDDFVRNNLVYRIFIVDSVRPYSSNKYTNFDVREHGLIVANAGPRLDDFTEAQWSALKKEIANHFTQGFYEAAEIKPIQFLALAKGGVVIRTMVEDPEEEYEKYQYTFYSEGYVKWMNMPHGGTNSMVPKAEQDFADYITFLTTTGKTELTHVLSRFSRMRERTLSIVPYLLEVLELNVVATQNKNCPEDPLPADFFEFL